MLKRGRTYTLPTAVTESAGLIGEQAHAPGDAPNTSDADQVLRHVRDISGSAQDPPALSNRQQQIHALMAHGLTDAEIALALGISYHTVRTHVKLLQRKFGVSRRRELLVLFAPSTRRSGDAEVTEFSAC